MNTAEVLELPSRRLGEEAYQRSKRYIDSQLACLNSNATSEDVNVIYSQGENLIRRNAIQINARKRLGQILGITLEAISERFALVESGDVSMEWFMQNVKEKAPCFEQMFTFAQQAVDNPNNPFTFEENVRAIIDELVHTYPYIPNPSKN